MHVSRKADYSVRALSYLASHPGRRILIHEVAQEMAVPKAFLSKIMKDLVRGKLVLSKTGPGGGYELARSPETITFRDIVELVEGPWNLVPCQEGDGPETCVLHEQCHQASVWDSIRLEMLRVLEKHTLLDGVPKTVNGAVSSRLEAWSGTQGTR